MNKFEKALSNLQECLASLIPERCLSSWMALSTAEDERLRQFRDKHYRLHKKDNGFIAHIFGTGVGTCYKIECPICHEKEDITDVSNW